jgi:hypothetical protein
MAENFAENVLPQTSLQGEENVVVVLLPPDSQSVESIPIENQINPDNLSSDVVTSEPAQAEASSSLENPTGVSTPGISLDTPLLQWTPQQTMYTSAEAIQQDIQILVNICKKKIIVVIVVRPKKKKNMCVNCHLTDPMISPRP